MYQHLQQTQQSKQDANMKDFNKLQIRYHKTNSVNGNYFGIVSNTEVQTLNK